MFTVLGIVFALFVELFFPVIVPAVIVFLIVRKVVLWLGEHPEECRTSFLD